MATAYKILGQSQPTNTNNATLYTVPASTEAIVSTITVANITSVDTSFRIHAVSPGGSATTGNAICYDVPLEANSFTAFTLGITLNSAASIVVRAGAGTAITFQAFGTELN